MMINWPINIMINFAYSTTSTLSGKKMDPLDIVQ